MTVGTLFRGFPDLRGNELGAEDLVYDEYFLSYNRSRRSNSMSKRERRINFLGPDDSASFQGRSTPCRKELHTRIAQPASIRELFKASEHLRIRCAHQGKCK